jgi:hypothetical protein
MGGLCRTLPLAVALATLAACGNDSSSSSTPAPAGTGTPDWSQWGARARHDGATASSAQDPARILASLTVDPFAAQEAADSGRDALVVHYQAPLLDGDDVFMTFKSGRWTSCNPPGSGRPAPCGSAAWSGVVWTVKRLTWNGASLAERWTAASDWKPIPDAGVLASWEPVFHPVLARGAVFMPGAGGSIVQLDRETGAPVSRIAPLNDAGAYVAGPLTADDAGNIYYTAMAVNPADPWRTDVRGAWLVKVPVTGPPIVASFGSLTPGAPVAGGQCTGAFAASQLPWPPSRDAVPPAGLCGSQRPGLNVAPAVAPDGTVYAVSRAHFNPRYGYVVAATSSLAPRWAASLRGRLSDGCGSDLMPPTGRPGGCRAGARDGVDPATNEPPAGLVVDLASSSPVVAPDASVIYGAYTRYNGSRGHLFRFSDAGALLATYDFGWDVTPAVYAHDGSFSVVIKDNHYAAGSYCGVPEVCPVSAGGPFRITQLTPELRPEWSFTATPTAACVRLGDGSISCSSELVEEPEWCINAPVVDRSGVVLAINEDGYLYAIGQGGALRRRTFLERAVGAAYTPLAVDRAGRTYAQNYGRLFALGQ